ncbi:unnamed protein product [Ophioblennius macclurei]
MTFYRNAVWFLNGIQQYTRKGFEEASRDFESKDLDVSVVGRTFMITGANSGIGRAAALAIAKKGGTVHMVCRDRDRAEEAQANIVHESGNTRVFVHIVDLSQTHKVWDFAQNFVQENSSLNVLINNAGCMLQQRELNAEGLEKNFATNTMGVYLLTQTLIPLLQKSRDPRVITVTSGGMLVQKLQSHDLQSQNGPFDGVKVYAQNKRQQVVLTQQWAAANPIIHFSAMHPGWVDSPAISSQMPEFHQMMGDRLRSVDQGADTLVWLALSPAASRTCSGQFFQDRKPVPAHLPLAWTRSPAEDVLSFMMQMENLARAVQSRLHEDPDSFLETSRPQFV